jgi:hypothetical protein
MLLGRVDPGGLAFLFVDPFEPDSSSTAPFWQRLRMEIARAEGRDRMFGLAAVAAGSAPGELSGR